jgi:hypothetical protein
MDNTKYVLIHNKIIIRKIHNTESSAECIIRIIYVLYNTDNGQRLENLHDGGVDGRDVKLLLGLHQVQGDRRWRARRRRRQHRCV